MSFHTVAPVPKWTSTVRIAQLVLAVLVLICDIVPAAIFVLYYGYPFGIFVCLCTVVITGYWLAANRGRPALYNQWAILGLDIFMVIFWLSSWSILAELAAALAYVGGIYDAYGNTTLDSNANWTAARVLTGIGAFLGAVEFVLFVITLVFHSVGIAKTRRGRLGQPGQQQGQQYRANGPAAMAMQDKNVPYPDVTELPDRRAAQQV